MPIHQFYADGTHRPLCRGWLHGVAAAVAVPSLLIHWNSLPFAAKPGLVAICTTLSLSSMLHLYPWGDAKWEEWATRLDRTSIVAVTGTILWTPQLLEHESCKPSTMFSTFSILLPTTLAALGIWSGYGSETFVGCVLASVAGLAHYSQLRDRTVFVSTLISGVLYGAGFGLYLNQTGGDAKVWGFHEWMHLFITIAFCFNAHGLLHMSTHWADGSC